MHIKKSVAMVVDWPRSKLETLDFSTFHAKGETVLRSETGIREAGRTNSRTGSTTRATTRRRGARRPGGISARRETGGFRSGQFADSFPCWYSRTVPEISATPLNSATSKKLKMILAGGAEAYKVKDLLRSKNIPVILRPDAYRNRWMKMMTPTIGC